jgi:AcrR family transcriptional regulator
MNMVRPSSARRFVSPQDRLLWTVCDSESMHSVLVAAVAEFAVKGFHGATTRDIARRASLSPAALYQHYATKEELLYTIAELTHQTVLSRMETAAVLSNRSGDRLCAVVAAMATFHAEVSVLTRIANNELHCLKRGHQDDVLSLRQQILHVIRKCLADGSSDGSFNVDRLNMMTNAILSMAIGVNRWFAADGQLSAEEVGLYYGRLALTMAIRGLE